MKRLADIFQIIKCINLAISLAFVGCIFAMIGFFVKEEK